MNLFTNPSFQICPEKYSIGKNSTPISSCYMPRIYKPMKSDSQIVSVGDYDPENIIYKEIIIRNPY